MAYTPSTEALFARHKEWKIPKGDGGEFSAIGVYNQFIYVDPSRKTVVVKLSANRAYGTSPGEDTHPEMETIELLRAIARKADCD